MELCGPPGVTLPHSASHQAPPRRGQFLWVNGSVFGGPWVLSPWLWGGPDACGLDMAVFLHPRQSGRYTVWIIERDKPPLALLSTDTLPRITGHILIQLS
ncbi:unnamed protein product [Boreogadus saida]